MSSESTKRLLEKKQATNRILRERRHKQCVEEKQLTNSLLQDRKADHEQSRDRFTMHRKLLEDASETTD